MTNTLYNEKLKLLRRRADALVVEARHLDTELEEVVELLRERYEAIHTLTRK